MKEGADDVFLVDFCEAAKSGALMRQSVQSLPS